mmetsp:Transcript_36716/g.56906  ORF Transcript_36716/g.56906 Transcript_36716/m.56906 type:complete len:375 (-) Transcript_36716:17-1141(-)
MSSQTEHVWRAWHIALVLFFVPMVSSGKRVYRTPDSSRSRKENQRHESLMKILARPLDEAPQVDSGRQRPAPITSWLAMFLFALNGVTRASPSARLPHHRSSGPPKASGLSEAMGSAPNQKRLAIWPKKQGASHRFIAKDDPTFQEYAFNKAIGYACKTRGTFQGTRRDGAYEATSRVQFTLPEKDDQPLTLELLQSNKNDNPSFGAVRTKLPLDAIVHSVQGRILVKQLNVPGNADSSQLRPGDIVRAISVPARSEIRKEGTPWWQQIGRARVPDAENGVVILDGRSANEFEAVLRENMLSSDEPTDVVLIIERPVKFFDGDKPSFRGGFPVQQDFGADSLPIPVLVEKDRDSDPLGLGFPMPSPPRGGQWPN